MSVEIPYGGKKNFALDRAAGLRGCEGQHGQGRHDAHVKVRLEKCCGRVAFLARCGHHLPAVGTSSEEPVRSST